jgi:3'-phosphoadenosine 5'-phosphosulfate sulfotransferase (PAPS reductase)/FAD synthetase
MRTQIWSSGGGVQSCAIAALIVRGVLQKPAYAVIIDTEREMSSTWEYMREVISPAL